MKKAYTSPKAKSVLFEKEEVLGPSGGDSPILNSKDENSTPKNPAEDFGSINIF